MTRHQIADVDERLDRLVNLDVGNRGVEHLYAAARRLGVCSLVGAAADSLASMSTDGIAILTTGSVSRAWISPTVAENDGPAGAAVLARALALGRRTTCVVLAEESLLPALAPIFTAAGLAVLPLQDAVHAGEGSLAAVALRSFPTDDHLGLKAASEVLDELRPNLLLSSERAGRNQAGVYHSMQGRDFGMGRARVDLLFDEANRRGIPTVAVGDGGNEIGMGVIASAVREHIPNGDRCGCGCGGGIGAVTRADALVTAACSNWGCYAISAALAYRLGDPRLLHTQALEDSLLRRGVEIGLIDSVEGRVEASVDGIPFSTQLAMVELIATVARPGLTPGVTAQPSGSVNPHSPVRRSAPAARSRT